MLVQMLDMDLSREWLTVTLLLCSAEKRYGNNWAFSSVAGFNDDVHLTHL